MISLVLFSFIAGLVTILAPCIWPLLPIVLASSIQKKGWLRPLGITLGIIISFTLFTVFISALLRLLPINANVFRLLAVLVIGLLGLTMIIPTFSTKLESIVSRFASKFTLRREDQNTDFITGFIIGLSLGIVWTPCAGPILATIAALVATQKVNTTIFFMTFAYSIGAGIPLFAFAYGGQSIITKMKGFSRYTGKIQQIFGGIMILCAIAIYTNFDQTLQLQLLQIFPQLGNLVNGFENSKIVTDQLNLLRNQQTTSIDSDPNGLFNENKIAPDFIGISKWLNTDKPLTIASLKGKVVLVDFWTYTCINCIRTLPHVTTWFDTYKDQGLVVIGVHTPEFEFEKDSTNVEDAIKRFNIHYPVAQDNNYATWNNYNNLYWPAEYLIDANGMIRYTSFGEGDYQKTEKAIQQLLKDAGNKVATTSAVVADQTPKSQLSPETYLGSSRMAYFYPNGNVLNGQQTFTLFDKPPLNSFSLGGDWTITNEYGQGVNNATLNYHFFASKVYIILKPENKNNKGTVKVYLDGKIIDSSESGSDVQNGTITVDNDRLYNIVDLKKAEEHIVKLQFETPNIQSYTFTFG